MRSRPALAWLLVTHVLARRLRLARPLTVLIAIAAFAAVCAPAFAAPGTASIRHPIVLLSYYSSSNLPTIEPAVRAAHLPHVPVFYGNYVGSDVADLGSHPPTMHVPRARRALIFNWVTNALWYGQRLSDFERGRLDSDGRSLTGGAPSLYTLLARGGSYAYHWGRELGRRFRDRIRELDSEHIHSSSYQFDEIPTNVLGSDGWKARDLIRGMMNGVAHGRRELGDRFMRGITLIANASLQLTSEPMTGELDRFWRTVDRNSLAVVGEEYPNFEGNPDRSAFVQSAGERTMIARGGSLGHLGDKYVTGITPGYRVVHGLGGNVKGRSDDGVNAWRADYLHARAVFGVAGFAAYQMLDRNGYDQVLRPMLKAFAAALRTEGVK